MQGNWFRWNRCARTQLGECWRTRIVYESQLDGLIDVDDTLDSADLSTRDPGQGLKKVLVAGVGLKLALRLMQEPMYIPLRIIYVAENPCWDWYTEQVKQVQTPADAFAYT